MFYFHPYLGRFPFRLIFFRWVETTTQYFFSTIWTIFAGSQDNVWFGSVTLYGGARRSTGACVYAWFQSVRWSVCVYRRCIHCILCSNTSAPLFDEGQFLKTKFKQKWLAGICLNLMLDLGPPFRTFHGSQNILPFEGNKQLEPSDNSSHC